MKISLNWLKEFVILPQISADELARKITEHAFEVEKVSASAKEYIFSNVFTAKVLAWQKHPNADRLRVVKLELGSGRIIEPVVCGAANFDVGSMVALALPGAFIPQNVHSEQHESFTLGTAKIRGVESQGMICSAFELGLAQAPELQPEILVLPAGTAAGLDLHDFLNSKTASGSKDLVLDVALPSNRPDLFSHLGIARELAGTLGYRLTPAVNAVYKMNDTKIKAPGKLAVRIENKEACRAYVGMRLKVKVKESPDFIKERLAALGVRSINNVVDITNYVMYEIGEPTHAFDAAKISGGIVVRSARPGEKIVTIDHKERILDAEMFVIADQEKPLAVGGVMGGVESEVNSSTTEIILEAANFEPAIVRKTSKRLGLRTDGSNFWEKGLRVELAGQGAVRALELLRKHADAEILESVRLGAAKTPRRSINFELAQINRLAGYEFRLPQVKKLLSGLGIKVSGTKKLKAELPYYRGDVESYADLADELIKIIGMNNIEKKPPILVKPAPAFDAGFDVYALKQALVEMGFYETQNYSFISKRDAEIFYSAVPDLLKVHNPLSADQEFLKRHLLIPLLKNTALNSKHSKAFKLFEIGLGYEGYLQEKELLTLVIYNQDANEQALFNAAKGTIERLSEKYLDSKPEFVLNNKGLVDFKVDSKIIGNMGMVSPRILKGFDIDQPVAYAKLDLAEYFRFRAPVKPFREYSKYPETFFDISVVLKNDVKWAEIERIVKEFGGPFLAKIEPFEAAYFYPKNELPEFHKKLQNQGLKNIAFRVGFQAPNRTLEASEISEKYAKIIAELKSKLGAEIR